MFTLKFIGHGNNTMNVSCPRYEVYLSPDGDSAHVIAYKDLCGDDGVQYTLTQENEIGPNVLWASMFVTNQTGKTVDTVRVKRTAEIPECG